MNNTHPEKSQLDRSCHSLSHRAQQILHLIKNLSTKISKSSKNENKKEQRENMDNSELVQLENGKILCPNCSRTFLAMGSAKLHFYSCRNKKKPKENLNNKEMEDSEQALWCICGQPDNFRFMICCDSCQHWYHGNCIGISKKVGKKLEEADVEWFCPKCKSKEENTSQDQTNISRP